MKKTTLCYIEKDNSYLMLHRTKKKNDMNSGKWLGIGGKIEQGETPDECLIREVFEETGLKLIDFSLKGLVEFISDIYEPEEMYLYHSEKFSGEIKECNEGELEWIYKSLVLSLPMWEGDKIFFKLLFENSPFFKLRLEYKGEILSKAYLNKKEINLC